MRFNAVALALAAFLFASPLAAQTEPAAALWRADHAWRLAKKVVAAAEAEAVRNNWQVAIAVIDSGGHLVMLQKLDNTQLVSIRVAEAKAKTALGFRLPTKTAGGRGRRRRRRVTAAGAAGYRAVRGRVPDHRRRQDHRRHRGCRRVLGAGCADRTRGTCRDRQSEPLAAGNPRPKRSARVADQRLALSAQQDEERHRSSRKSARRADRGSS